jgi:hypothetical protein
LNPIQNWALQYWLYMERRIKLDDKQAELEFQCFHLNPERYDFLYVTPKTGDMGSAFGNEPELPITDPADLDHWFENLANQRGMSGAEAERLLGNGSPGGGRRV